MRRASRLVGLKLNIVDCVIDTKVVLKWLFALHRNAMLSSRHTYLCVPRNYVACMNKCHT